MSGGALSSAVRAGWRCGGAAAPSDDGDGDGDDGTMTTELRAGADTMDVAMETERIVGTAAYMPHE